MRSTMNCCKSRLVAWPWWRKSPPTSASITCESGSGSATRDPRRSGTPGRGMGLPKGEMEALFRVLLRATAITRRRSVLSCLTRRQSLTVAVVGGRGAMGALVARMSPILDRCPCRRSRDRTFSSDAAKLPTLHGHQRSDRRHRAGDSRGWSASRAESLLMSNEREVGANAGHARGNAGRGGWHAPMFGPSVHSFRGSASWSCRGRGDHWANWSKPCFSEGPRRARQPPEHHDRMMATVAGADAFPDPGSRTYARATRCALAESLRFTSPAYPWSCTWARRHLRAIRRSLRPDRDEQSRHPGL